MTPDCNNVIFVGDDTQISITILDKNGIGVNPSIGKYKIVLFTNDGATRTIVSANNNVFTSNKLNHVSKCEVIAGELVVYYNRMDLSPGQLKIYITNSLENLDFDDGYQDVSSCTTVSNITVVAR